MLLAQSLNRKITISIGQTIVFQNIDAVWYREPNETDEVSNDFVARIPLDTDAKVNFFKSDYQDAVITLVGQDNPKYKVNKKKTHFSPLAMFNRVDLLLQET